MPLLPRRDEGLPAAELSTAGSLLLAPLPGAEEAAREFAEHGLSPYVTVRQRNIEALGFPCGGRAAEAMRRQRQRAAARGDGSPGAGEEDEEEEEDEGEEGGEEGDGAKGAAAAEAEVAGAGEEVDLAGAADAVFLDLPAPYKVRGVGGCTWRSAGPRCRNAPPAARPGVGGAFAVRVL